MVSTWSKLFVADDVVLGAPKFLKFVAVADRVNVVKTGPVLTGW